MQENHIEMGIQSQLLKENAVFQFAIEDLRRGLYQRWLDTDFSDVENREEIYRLRMSLELMVSKLDQIVTNAENEQFKNNSEQE